MLWAHAAMAEEDKKLATETGAKRCARPVRTVRPRFRLTPNSARNAEPNWEPINAHVVQKSPPVPSSVRSVERKSGERKHQLL